MKNLFISVLFAVCMVNPSHVRAQKHSMAEADTLMSRAERLANLGKASEAMPLLKDAKKRYEAMDHIVSAEYGKCLHQMSYCYFVLDSLQIGLEYAMKAAEIRKQTLGDTHDDYLMTMNNIGSYYFMTNDLDKSEKVYREILAKCQYRQQVTKRYSFFSSNAARVFMKKGNKAQAERVLDSTIILVRRDYGDTGKVLGDAASDCANVELAFGDYCKAAAYMEIALLAYEKYSDGYGKMLDKLGLIYISHEMCYDANKAMRIMSLTEELNVYELSKSCEDIACLTNRAEYYSSKDKIEEARATYLKALSAKGTLQEQRDLKTSYAGFLSNQKMYQDAALYYKFASEDEKLLNGESPQYAFMLYMSGLLYNNSQKRSDAVECLMQSSNAYANLGGDENMKKSYKSLQSVGAAFSIDRKFEEAFKYYTQAMNGMKRWPQSEEYASVLSDVAKTECNLGYFDSSLVHYREALHIYENLQITSEHTKTLQMIQYTLTKAGRKEEADSMEDVINQSVLNQVEKVLEEEKANLPMYRSIWGEDGFQYAQALGAIAESEYNLGYYLDGTMHYSMYIPAIRASFVKMFTVMNASEREALWRNAKNALEHLYMNVFDFPDTDSLPNPEMCRLAYDASLLSKGILLNSSIEFMKVLEESGSKDAMEQFERIERNATEIVSLQSSVSMSDTDGQLLKLIKEKKEENARLEIELRGSCPELERYTDYLSYTWKDVQHSLGPDDMAIEMVDVGEGVSYEHYIVALVITKNCDAPIAVPLCKRLILQKLLRATKGKVYDQNDGGLFFWAAILPFFEGKKHIYFSPEAEVHQLAVEYLKVDGVPLFDRYPLYRVSSTKEICRKRQVHEKQKVAIFGDIEYAYGVDVSKKRGADNLGKLPYTKVEIESSSMLLNKKKTVIDVYSKLGASEEAFRNISGKGVTMLHIASHGLYVAPRRASEQEAMQGSLLAFCGYNVVGADSINDGKVSAEDVSRMNLRDCEMVVLSACKTGLGEKGSDGIFGLQRGFKNAGAGAIVMSIRNVHDEATAQLMTAFYRELASGATKREALKKAMAEIRGIDKYKKAEYWASFIMLDGLD